MIRRLLRRSVAFLATTVASLVLVAAALAYWTTTGSGTAPGTTPTVQALTLSAATPSAELHPGGTSDVAVSVSNPNPLPVRLVSLSLDTAQAIGGFGIDAGHSGCDLATLGFTTQTNGGAGWTVPPKVGATNGTLAVDLTGALSMSMTASDACQGASFIVHLTAGS